MTKLTFKALLAAARLIRQQGASIHDTMLFLSGIKIGAKYHYID